jgi:hypothetical protein
MQSHTRRINRGASVEHNIHDLGPPISGRVIDYEERRDDHNDQERSKHSPQQPINEPSE